MRCWPFLLFAVLLALVPCAPAAVWYVHPSSGDDGQGGGSWSEAFATLGQATSVQAEGDTIVVAAGDTLRETVVFSHSASLWPVEAGSASITPIAERPFVLTEPETDPGNDVLLLADGIETVRVVNAVADGDVDGDGLIAKIGFYARNGATLVITRCVARHLTYGISVFHNTSKVIVEQCRTEDNENGVRAFVGTIEIDGLVSVGDQTGLRNQKTVLRADHLLLLDSEEAAIYTITDDSSDSLIVRHATIHNAPIALQVNSGPGYTHLFDSIVDDCDTALFNEDVGTLESDHLLLWKVEQDTLGTVAVSSLLHANPLFRSLPLGDFHLNPFSPARHFGSEGGYLGALPALQRSDLGWGRPRWSQPGFGQSTGPGN